MKNKYLIMYGGMALIIGFLIGFSITMLANKSPQYGTIYLKPDEIQYAPGLKDKTGANVIVIGLLGKTINDIIPTKNVEDII